MTERNAAIPPQKRIQFRAGINLGDVIAEEHDIFGDGVNVALGAGPYARPG
jgi:adenylate cyclase